MLINILLVALGSALGGACRYGLSLLENTYAANISWTTLIVNIAGGFLIGLLAAYFTFQQNAPLLKLLLITGFCGGFTTFSTFSLDVVNQLQNGELQTAFWLTALHVVGAISATFLGLVTMLKLFQGFSS